MLLPHEEKWTWTLPTYFVLNAMAATRARPMYRHTDISAHRYISADLTMLPMYRISKIPPIYIGNICS